MDKINVMHITNNIGYASSVERLILTLTEKIDKSRFSISIVSLTKPERVSKTFLDSARNLGAPTNLIPWKRSKPFAASILKLIKLIKKYEIDIVITHEVRTNLVGMIAAKLTGVKAVASIHGWVMDTVPFSWKLYQHFDRRVIRRCNHIIVGSDFLRNEIIKMGLSSQKVSTIHYAIDTTGLDLSASSMNFKKKFDLNSTDTLIGTVGRISREKGHKYLLDAAKIVIQEHPDVKFLIVGEGEIRTELETYAKSLDIFNNVIFTGYYKNLSEALAVIDLFVIPSLTESLPLAVLEAMAAGKPVISTNVGGIPEIIIHGETGLLVRPQNGMELANSITTMLNNNDLRIKMAKKGKQLVNTQFSIQNFIEQTENLYSNIICNHT